MQPLALRLLLALCEANGRAVGRRELFDRLWPRQAVADESLTQQTAKLREALGPYAACVVTVRKVGLRLDAALQRMEAEAAPEQTSDPAPQVQAASTADDPPVAQSPPARPQLPSRRHWGWYVGCAIALALVAVLGWQATRPDPLAPLPGGAGLRQVDLADEQASTADAVRRALQLDADGRRDEALVLLRITSEADPQSPLPTLYLAWIEQARGDGLTASRWAALTRERLGARPAERLRLLLRQIERARKPPDSESLAVLNLMAEGQAAAPATSLAKAHAWLARNGRDQALAELRAIQWDQLEAANVPVALGDLAALGDAEAARQRFEQLRSRLSAALQAETTARIAAAAGDYATAWQAVVTAMAAGPSERARSRLHALLAVYATHAGELAAVRADATALAAGSELADNAMLQFNLLLVQAGMPDVDASASTRMLQRAAALVPTLDYPGACWEIDLIAGLARLPSEVACNQLSADAAKLPGLTALLRATAHWRQGSPEAAAAQLALAREGGIGATLFAAHAQALAHLLDPAKAVPAVSEPPYPLWSRHPARWIALRARP